MDLAELAQRLQSWSRRPRAQRLAAEGTLLATMAALAAALPRIPQPESYHSFAGDQRSWLGIPHAPNVLSNAAIAATGLLGLAEVWRSRKIDTASSAGSPAGSGRAPSAAGPGQGAGQEVARKVGGTAGTGGAPFQALLWAATFASMLVAAWGSAYYHWAPSTPRLAADRFGMGLTFGWLAAAASIDRRGRPQGPLAWLAATAAVLLPPATALYWRASEAAGAGDLRWYGLAQALPGKHAYTVQPVPCLFL
jgi:hypothetical protein